MGRADTGTYVTPESSNRLSSWRRDVNTVPSDGKATMDVPDMYGTCPSPCACMCRAFKEGVKHG